MDFNIRKMKKSDWDSVRNIYEQGINTNIATFEVSVPSYAMWNKSHSKICRLVIIYNNAVAGFSALSKVSNREVYNGVAEVSIYIDSNYKKKGLGEKLLRELIIESENNGIWVLQSSILEDNKPSVALHKKCGFRIVGYREKIAKNKFGEWKNTLLMERRSELEKYN